MYALFCYMIGDFLLDIRQNAIWLPLLKMHIKLIFNFFVLLLSNLCIAIYKLWTNGVLDCHTIEDFLVNIQKYTIWLPFLKMQIELVLFFCLYCCQVFVWLFINFDPKGFRIASLLKPSQYTELLFDCPYKMHIP